MPTTRAGSSGADPFSQARVAARELVRQTGVEQHDVFVVLGTGLSPVAEILGAEAPPIDLAALPWFPRYSASGHRPLAWSVSVGSVRVLVTAGRLHLYEGLSAAEVVHPIRTAAAAGCRLAILTCAAGGINPVHEVGDVVAITDHLNLTGTSPLTGITVDPPVGSPHVDLTETWSARLRGLAHGADPLVRDGVYAQVQGPQLETPAEVRMLGMFGADLVGMSMALEAIAGRHLGLEMLGLAVVSNPAAGLGTGPIGVEDIHDAAGAASERIARLATVVARTGGN